MRILKYIVLLILLFLVGLTVFIITQKGDYSITRSKVIKAPRSTIYTFVNDYRNWETFASWSEENGKTQFIFPTKTAGVGAKCSWDGTSEGSIKTIAVKENTFIEQKMIFNETETEGKWTFKDTLGKTKVTWQTKGTMSVMMKIKAFLNGGINQVIGSVYEKSLVNLDRTLDYELNTFAIQIDGIVAHPKTFFLSQTINSYDDKVTKNIKIMMPKMIGFFEKNKMVMHGKPFVLYNSFDQTKQTTNFSVCIPVKDSISIMAGSDITSGKMDAFSAVKATLSGDYSHLKQADQKVLQYIIEKGLQRNVTVSPYYVYKKSFMDDKFPSKWKTELYYPIIPKKVVAPVLVTPKPVSTTENQ